MKKLCVMLAALLAVVLPEAAPAIDAEGIYVGGLGGVNFLNAEREKNHHHDNLNFRNHRRHRDNFLAGWIAGLDIGYRACEGYRVEVEATFRENKLKSRSARRDLINGICCSRRPAKTWSLMANGYYEISQCWCVTPYIGAGIGYDNVDFKRCRNRLFDSSTRHHRNRNDKGGFGWQVMLGGLMPLDDCMEAGLEYRFHMNQAFKHFNLYNNALLVKINWFF